MALRELDRASGLQSANTAKMDPTRLPPAIFTSSPIHAFKQVRPRICVAFSTASTLSAARWPAVQLANMATHFGAKVLVTPQNQPVLAARHGYAYLQRVFVPLRANSSAPVPVQVTMFADPRLRPAESLHSIAGLSALYKSVQCVNIG